MRRLQINLFRALPKLAREFEGERGFGAGEVDEMEERVIGEFCGNRSEVFGISADSGRAA